MTIVATIVMTGYYAKMSAWDFCLLGMVRPFYCERVF
jgi:hypothetical protein